MRPTVEREGLLGSAYKRLTMVQTRAGRAREAQAALDAAVHHYEASETLARKAGVDKLLFYPAKNAISCALRAALLKKRLPVLDAGRVKAVNDSLHQAATEEPDFWSVVGQTELLVLSAVARGQLAPALPGALASLRDLAARVPAGWMWDLVYNEAQFTLLPYLQMASAAEKHAAQNLLDALKEMAAAS